MARPPSEAREAMERLFADDPTIGRKRLMKLTGASSGVAQRFLEGKRKNATAKAHLDNVQTNPAGPLSVTEEARIVVENRRLRQQLSEQTQQIAELSAAHDLLCGLSKVNLEPPKWLSGSSGKTHRAIPTAVLADTHFDEVVRPAEVGWVNAYDRNIAQLRLREFFSNTVRLGSEFFSGITMEGLTLAVAGDIVSGNIHEELAQTNAAAILDTCLFWSEEIAAGIEHLLPFYGKVFCPCVVGNHGRQSKKPRNKGRVRDNFDYLIYSLVARHFKDDDRVSFLIPDTADAHYQIYDTRYVLTHGDQFRGGTGIAGALSPLLLGDARKRKRSNATNRPYDYMVLGHWHQDIDTCGIIACNSMKGYDEFAANSNFAFSEPSQAFWLTDSEKGRTLRAPIHVRSKHERWDGVGESSQPGWLQEESGA